MSKKVKAEPITGVAYTVEASKDQGFSNYRILTLFIVDGELIHIERSQPFSSFEAIARTEVLIDASIWNLSSRYADGVVQGMGGEARDALVSKLKKQENQALLDKILPAIGVK